jgi:hypothetical protein
LAKVELRAPVLYIRIPSGVGPELCELPRILLPRRWVNKLGIHPRFIGNSSPPASMDRRSNPVGVAREKEGALMRRMIMLVVVALVMAATLALGAGSAFAKDPVPPTPCIPQEEMNVPGNPTEQANNVNAVCHREFAIV